VSKIARAEFSAYCERAGHHRKVLFFFYLPAEALALPKPLAKCRSAQAGKKNRTRAKSEIANKTFLWWGER